MTNKNALNVMEHIDPEMIEEAEAYKKRSLPESWVRWGMIAACLCVCITGALMLSRPAEETVQTGFGLEEGKETAEIAQTVSGGANHSDIVPGGIYNGAEVPYQENAENGSDYNVKMMIGHFDNSLNDEDMAVNNGCYELSGSLRAAIGELGDTVRYRVVVEVFKDGTVISSGSAEVAAEEARLVKEEYIVAHETYEDDAEAADWFTIHAEKDQLLNFPASSSYGYYISLYDECLGLAAPMEDTGTVFNAPSITVDAPADGSVNGAMKVTEMPAGAPAGN